MNETPGEVFEIVFVTSMFATLIGLFWLSYDWSVRAKSGEKLPGKRFVRALSAKPLEIELIHNWAQKNNYLRHQSSTSDCIVFLKKDYPIYPIFISVNSQSKFLEAWVCSGIKDIAITSGFHLIGSERMGLKDLNSLLVILGETKVE